LAVELGPHSIRVNTVNPGVTDTPLTFNEPTARAFVPDLADPGRDDLAELYAGLNLLPISTLQPIDIANAVVWLTSDEARYVTGVALPVDAGGLWK